LVILSLISGKDGTLGNELLLNAWLFSGCRVDIAVLKDCNGSLCFRHSVFQFCLHLLTVRIWAAPFAELAHFPAKVVGVVGNELEADMLEPVRATSVQVRRFALVNLIRTTIHVSIDIEDEGTGHWWDHVALVPDLKERRRFSRQSTG
jgi:hypothetical protein